MTATQPNVLVFGAGPVGATVSGWLTEHYEKVWLLGRQKLVETLRASGLSLYLGGDKEHIHCVQIRAIAEIEEAPTPEIVVLAVKTYHLESVCEFLKNKLGDAPIVVALQNGVESQKILPKYFSKVVYGVVGYNTWIDEPGVVGYQKKGPLVLGTPDGKCVEETRVVTEILGRGVESICTHRFQDAMYSKMVLLLINSLQALIGHPSRSIENRELFQRVLTNMMWEGVIIVKAKGHHEFRIPGLPTFRLIWASAKLPRILTGRAFEKNAKKMVLSSMAQDIQRGSRETELEALNGHFLELADQYGLAVPYNRAVYGLCKERFGKPGFMPMSIEEVWACVEKRLH